jgi:cyanophycin synthetase
MQILEIRTFSGPNIFNHKPVLRMTLDLQDLYERESYEVPRFVERLLTCLPGVHQHGCGKGEPGGFIERLHGGTYFGHIVEHVALELTEPVGIPATYGKTVSAPTPGCYYVVVEYKSELGMRALLRVAVDLVEALVAGQSFPLEERLEDVRRLVRRTALGPSTKAIADAAARRGIPWTRISDGSLLRLGYGRHMRYLQAAVSGNTSDIAVDMASDKALAKRLLDEAGIPVPNGIVVSSLDEASDIFEQLGTPLAVKPVDGNHGNGITLYVTTRQELRAAFHDARQVSSKVLIEEQFEGEDYRVLVINGRVVAASQRIPAHVIGNGLDTVDQLIRVLNDDPRRGEGHEKALTRVSVDARMLSVLQRQGLSLAAVPERDQRVVLSDTANLSTGGTAVDVTDALHPELGRMCERAAKAIGLDICGVDLVVPTIEAPFESGGIVEVNAGPGLRMHLFPDAGTPRDVATSIVEMLYPHQSNGRIPIISVTGTNGKTTTTRMIGHTVERTGHTVGMTTTDGIDIGGSRVVTGDTTGPRSARTVLMDRSVDVAVLETARGGIMRGGLGYDWSDIGVITNIQWDHVGQDGIEDLDDIVHVKSLVAERVRAGGTLVLNADDPTVMGLLSLRRVQRVSRHIILFSLHSDNPHVQSHRKNGGTAVYLHDGVVMECNGDTESAIVDVETVPVTLHGLAEFQIANVLAATAACRAFGLSPDAVAAGMRSFSNDSQNLGRCTMYCVKDGYAVLDYGHNPEAIASVLRLAHRCPVTRVTAVLSLPGDRADWFIQEAAKVAARGCHRLIVHEDEDRRGRREGEVPELILSAAQEASPSCQCRIVRKSADAVQTALQDMMPGEIIVIFCDQFQQVTQLLEEYDAVVAPKPQHPLADVA